jgi:hypothetical protein
MHTSVPVFHPARILDGFIKLRFLPALFGDDFIRAENNIYIYAARYLHDYEGGAWDYAVLPEGGGFMKPEGDTRWRFVNPLSDADLSLGSEAAGIVITALVLNHRSWMYDHHDEEELCRLYCQRHRELMAYAGCHPEADAILRALD